MQKKSDSFCIKDSDCTELFGVSVSETMAARGLVNGRGPPRSGGRDSAKRVVSDTDTPKSSLEYRTKYTKGTVPIVYFCVFLQKRLWYGKDQECWYFDFGR